MGSSYFSGPRRKGCSRHIGRMNDDGSRRFAATHSASVRFSLARSKGLPENGITRGLSSVGVLQTVVRRAPKARVPNTMVAQAAGVLGPCNEHRRHPDFREHRCGRTGFRLLALVVRRYARSRSSRRIAGAVHDRDRRGRLHLRRPSLSCRAHATRRTHRRARAGFASGPGNAPAAQRCAGLVRTGTRISAP